MLQCANPIAHVWPLVFPEKMTLTTDRNVPLSLSLTLCCIGLSTLFSLSLYAIQLFLAILYPSKDYTKHTDKAV